MPYKILMLGLKEWNLKSYTSLSFESIKCNTSSLVK